MDNLPRSRIVELRSEGVGLRQVTAAVIVEKGRLLVTRRSPGQNLAGMWELPGGKVELGETPQQCLARELLEELSMRSEPGQVLARTEYVYEHGAFQMLALSTVRLSGFTLSVHDAYCWATPSDARALKLAPADVSLVEQLVQERVF